MSDALELAPSFPARDRVLALVSGASEPLRTELVAVFAAIDAAWRVQTAATSAAPTTAPAATPTPAPPSAPVPSLSGGEPIASPLVSLDGVSVLSPKSKLRLDFAEDALFAAFPKGGGIRVRSRSPSSARSTKTMSVLGQMRRAGPGERSWAVHASRVAIL